MQWNGDRVLAQLETEITRRVTSAAVLVTGAMIHETATPYPPASTKGNAPHMRSGDLNRSIDYSVQSGPTMTTAKVIAKARHARWLEKGTSKMAARPFALRALMDKKSQVHSILTGGGGAESPGVSFAAGGGGGTPSLKSQLSDLRTASKANVARLRSQLARLRSHRSH